MMVEPEREVPGTMESTWKRPMPRAVLQSRSSMSWTRASASATCETVSSCWGWGAAAAKWRGRYDAEVCPAVAEAMSLLARRSRRVSITMKAMP